MKKKEVKKKWMKIDHVGAQLKELEKENHKTGLRKT